MHEKNAIRASSIINEWNQNKVLLNLDFWRTFMVPGVNRTSCTPISKILIWRFHRLWLNYLHWQVNFYLLILEILPPVLQEKPKPCQLYPDNEQNSYWIVGLLSFVWELFYFWVPSWSSYTIQKWYGHDRGAIYEFIFICELASSGHQFHWWLSDRSVFWSIRWWRHFCHGESY